MTDSTGSPADIHHQAPPPLPQVVRSLLRAAGSTAALVALYYLLPLDHSAHWAAVTMLSVGLAALVTLIAFQVRWIIASPFPGLRALEALATSVPLFLLLFASAYVVMGAFAARNFCQPMNHTNALYFTVKTEAARLVVTGQMIVDLIIIGLGARVILGAVTRGRQRRLPPGTGSTQSSS